MVVLLGETLWVEFTDCDVPASAVVESSDALPELPVGDALSESLQVDSSPEAS